MVDTKYQFAKQDYNGILHDAVAITADTDSAVQNSGVPGGIEAQYLVLDVSNRATGESVHWILKQGSTTSPTEEVLRVHGIAASGRYVMKIDNKIVTKQYWMTTKDVTLPTGGGLTITEFTVLSSDQD